MSSASLPSLFVAGNGRRSFRAPVVSVRAWKLTHDSLTHHSHSHRNLDEYGSKRGFGFSCESTSSDVSHTNPASSATGYYFKIPIFRSFLLFWEFFLFAWNLVLGPWIGALFFVCVLFIALKWILFAGFFGLLIMLIIVYGNRESNSWS